MHWLFNIPKLILFLCLLQEVAKGQPLIHTREYTPLVFSPAGWYDSSDATTLTHTANAVTQLNDKSGNARHITATGSTRPTRVTGAQNGLTGIQFDGADDILSTANAGCNGVTNVTIFLVMKLISADGSEDLPIALNQALQSSRCRTMYRSPSSSLVQFASWSNDVSTSHTYDAGGGYHVYSVVQNGQSIQVGKDGSYQSVSTPQGLFPVNTNYFSIGGIVGSSGYYTNMILAEAVIVYTNLTQTQIQKEEGRLAWKWGLQTLLPSGHPYKSTIPLAYNPAYLFDRQWAAVAQKRTDAFASTRLRFSTNQSPAIR